MVQLNKPMGLINEPMKVIPGDHAYCLPNNFTLCHACQDKSCESTCFKNKQINLGKQTVKTKINNENLNIYMEKNKN